MNTILPDTPIPATQEEFDLLLKTITITKAYYYKNKEQFNESICNHTLPRIIPTSAKHTTIQPVPMQKTECDLTKTS
jgi:hypothetical protein